MANDGQHLNTMSKGKITSSHSCWKENVVPLVAMLMGKANRITMFDENMCKITGTKMLIKKKIT